MAVQRPPKKNATRPELRAHWQEAALENDRLRGLLAQVVKLASQPSQALQTPVHLSSIVTLASAASDIPRSPPPPPTAPAPSAASGPKSPPKAQARVLKHLSPLTQEQKEELIKKDICLRCREPGHRSFDASCPNNDWRALSKAERAISESKLTSKPPAVQTVTQSMLSTVSETPAVTQDKPWVMILSEGKTQAVPPTPDNCRLSALYFPANNGTFSPQLASEPMRKRWDWSPAVKNSAIAASTSKAPAKPTIPTSSAASKPAAPSTTATQAEKIIAEKTKAALAADKKARLEARVKSVLAADADTVIAAYNIATASKPYKGNEAEGLVGELFAARKYFEQKEESWFVRNCFHSMKRLRAIRT